MIVSNIASLKALTCGGEVWLLGYSAPGDGGGGAFYYDVSSTTADDGGTVIAPTSGVGRWERIYSGAVHVDWFGANSSDATAAFLAASNFQQVEASPRNYLMNGAVTIKEGQQWDLKGALVYHTDNTKVMFSAAGINRATFQNCDLKGTLASSGFTGEKGLYLEGCGDVKVSGVTARLFKGQGFHIAPGSRLGYKAERPILSGCAAFENMVGFQIDNGSGSEYVTITGIRSAGNITGLSVGAGNVSICGGSITNNSTGVILTGGDNNGHGTITGVNINHNGGVEGSNVVADGVTKGFTFTGCHIYGDSASVGMIWHKNGSTNITYTGGVIDADITNSSGSNRATGVRQGPLWAVAGSGFTATDCF